MKSRFKELLKNKRYNLTTLSKAMGLSRPTVRNWTIGHGTPSPEKIKKMSELLECTTDEVINALLEK